jgi:transposase
MKKGLLWGQGEGFEEKKLICLRRRVSELFYEVGVSKNRIAKRLGVSKKFVIRWTKSMSQAFDVDYRGWRKGKGRKWDEKDRARVGEIHTFLTGQPEHFFWGATAVQQEWQRLYPADPVPPLRTVGRFLAELGLSEKQRITSRGAAKYLCYPEHTIYEKLGLRLLEADFIGKKFITGRTEPVNFIGFSFKKSPRLRYFQRVANETAETFMAASRQFFKRFEVPGAVKVDNCGATIGSGRGPRNLSRVMVFLLENKIVPIFSVPRRPFSQGSIEGNNSVFSRKFWNRERFESLDHIDRRLELFNLASQRYSGYQCPSSDRPRSKFIPRVYFIRQVRSIPESSKGGSISVLNQEIPVAREFVNYFVLAEWNLIEEKLFIHFEKEQNSELIGKITFPISCARKSPRLRAQKIKRLG